MGLDSLGTTQEGTEQENLDVEDELLLPKVLTDELKHSKDFQLIVEVCCHSTAMDDCRICLLHF